ncbi:MAG: MFS transporter [[Clostridium] scindens]
MRAKKYILSMAMVYMAYFTHGIQAIILSQNKVNFFTQWGYTDEVAGAAAVSLAITATGFGKFLTVWLGGEISDKIGRKKMAVAGGILYIVCFAGLLFSTNFTVACVCAFLAGVATSGFWDASLYPAVQESLLEPRFAGSAFNRDHMHSYLVSGIIYPLLAVQFSAAGNWHINVWIPLVMSVVCVVLAVIATTWPMTMMMKETGTDRGRRDERTRPRPSIEAARAQHAWLSRSGLVNSITMFYGFVCMFIMYGAQQYTKAFGNEQLRY